MWTHKKFGKKPFVGRYERDKDAERVFVLRRGKRKISFESWQMAKKVGWKKEY